MFNYVHARDDRFYKPIPKDFSFSVMAKKKIREKRLKKERE